MSKSTTKVYPCHFFGQLLFFVGGMFLICDLTLDLANLKSEDMLNG